MAKDSFLKQHTKPKMVLAMGGLGYLGLLVGGPLVAAAGVYAGHLLGKPSKPNKPKKPKEHIKGGRAEGIPDSAFDAEQLRLGTEVEYEHTKDMKIAREIAKDHLAEYEDYYRALAQMEHDLEQG